MDEEIIRRAASTFCLVLTIGVVIVMAVVTFHPRSRNEGRPYDFDATLRKMDRQFYVLASLEVLTLLGMFALAFKSAQQG